MKLYKTYSNGDTQRNNVYRVSIPDLGIVRWSNEELRYVQTNVWSWEYASIPKGTAMPDFWSVK